MKNAIVNYCIVGTLLLSTPAIAGLAWEQKVMEMHPKLMDAQVVVEYHFKNEGTNPVTITGIQPGCSCINAVTDKKTYASGESGTLTATFTIGPRVGRQITMILVKTDQPDEPVTELQLRGEIPVLLTFTPNAVTWEPMEGKKPKEISVRVAEGGIVRVVGVRTTDERVFAQVKVVKEGKEYRIVLTPSTVNEPVKADVRIETDFPPPPLKPRYLWVKAEIKAAKPLVPPPSSTQKP